MNKNEVLQNLWKQYETANNHEPTGTRAVVTWAVSKGLLELPDVDPYDVLATQMAQALRAQTAVDKYGRTYRVNHSVRIGKHGVQRTLWSEIGFASREHMQISFAQRREQIVGDCVQLKTDVDAYNERNPKSDPIQLELDFTEDVAERRIIPVLGPGTPAVAIA
jgi:hypothetical protein